MFYRKPFKPDKKEIKADVWKKCENCGETLHVAQLEKNLWVCSKCSFHFRIPAKKYIEIVFEENTFEELFLHIESDDPLNFPDYKKKYKKAKEETGLKEACITGKGKIDKFFVSAFISDFSFMGGSMGSAYGEKFYLICEYATKEKLPLIAITSSGGGARMQEGIISLMQLVKTNIGVKLLKENRIPYITVLCDPTMGGVMASFAALGDISLAEKGALLGFAGPRVIEQTIKQKLPPGFQRAEFQFEHGMIDEVIDRRELKKMLIKILSIIWD
ncbi:MAG: acetyl-CoA carboxylase, carboxyltransferase subunit beta [Candidatus Hydrothermales bacterium]